MPTYTCTAGEGLLDRQQKSSIADAITKAHSEITGAPSYFAQVIFQEVPEGDHFIGGRALEHDQVFVYGRIRAGRSAVDRSTLIRRITDEVSNLAKLPTFSVWVYLLELPAAAMVEFGHVLPEPGNEPDWNDELPSKDRERMEAILTLGNATYT